jgi:CheY-like chemotaxis protein
MNTAVEETPVALIVEDQPKFLETLKDLFEGEGFRAIGAPSMAAALRELRSTPAVDLVFTDYGLNTEDKDRESGGDLKNEILKIRQDMPIVLYSARFEDRQIPDSVREGFFDILPKARTEDIYERIPVWEEKALDYRRRRVSFAKQELARLVEKYEMTTQDVSILRDFLPGADLPASGAPDAQPDDGVRTVDEILRRAGYRLRLIDTNTLVPGEKSSNGRTVVPVLLWLCVRDYVYIAELYNHPCVYGDGATENEAVEDVLKLMYGYYCDFRDNPELEQSGDLERLVTYLNKVFG